MIVKKMDIDELKEDDLKDDELKEVSGGWTIRHDDLTFWVLDDKTAEYLDGPFYSIAEAEARAKELGQTWRGISPAILEHLRKKNQAK